MARENECKQYWTEEGGGVWDTRPVKFGSHNCFLFKDDISAKAEQKWSSPCGRGRRQKGLEISDTYFLVCLFFATKQIFKTKSI